MSSERKELIGIFHNLTHLLMEIHKKIQQVIQELSDDVKKRGHLKGDPKQTALKKQFANLVEIDRRAFETIEKVAKALSAEEFLKTPNFQKIAFEIAPLSKKKQQSLDDLVADTLSALRVGIQLAKFLQEVPHLVEKQPEGKDKPVDGQVETRPEQEGLPCWGICKLLKKIAEEITKILD